MNFKEPEFEIVPLTSQKKVISTKNSKNKLRPIIFILSFALIGIGILLIFRANFLKNPSFGSYFEQEEPKKLNNISNLRILRADSADTLGFNFGAKLSKQYLSPISEGMPILLSGSNFSIVGFLFPNDFLLSYKLQSNISDLKMYSDQSISYISFDFENKRDNIIIHKSPGRDGEIIYSSDKDSRILSHFFEVRTNTFYILEKNSEDISLFTFSAFGVKFDLDIRSKISSLFRITGVLDAKSIYFTDGIECLEYIIQSKDSNKFDCSKISINNLNKNYFQKPPNLEKFTTKPDGELVYWDGNKNQLTQFRKFEDTYIPQFSSFFRDNLIFVLSRVIQSELLFERKFEGIYSLNADRSEKLLTKRIPSVNSFGSMFLIGNYLFLVSTDPSEKDLLYLDLDQEGVVSDPVSFPISYPIVDGWKSYLDKGFFADIGNIRDIKVLEESFVLI